MISPSFRAGDASCAARRRRCLLSGGNGWNRTTDTRLFKPVLYLNLSYVPHESLPSEKDMVNGDRVTTGMRAFRSQRQPDAPGYTMLELACASSRTAPPTRVLHGIILRKG